MGYSRLPQDLVAITLTLLVVWPASAGAETEWTVREGTTTLHLDSAALREAGVSVATARAQGASAPEGRQLLDIASNSTLRLRTDGGALEAFAGGSLRHTDGLLLLGGNETLLDGFAISADVASSQLRVTSGAAPDDVPALHLVQSKIAFDQMAEALLVEGDLQVTTALANELGAPDLREAVVGMILIRAVVEWTGGDEPTAPPPGSDFADGGSRTECDNPVGPDVIVGELIDISNYSSVGGIEAFAVGTTSCNIGDENLLWIASTNEHPVIGQNMYQLKDGRLRQVGQSWLKHGFTALTQDACDCGCNGQGGSVLGVGCSDPYCCGLNGSQTRLGPRFEVDAHTGNYRYPYTYQGQTGDSIYKRLQVHISDLDPAQDGGGQYFVEGHYITADDALAGNGNNNASYRPITVSGSGSSWSASLTGDTQREQPALRAWADYESGVNETDVQVPGEGVFLMAQKTSDAGGGMWHYEYAVQNLNSHRSMGWFAIPLPEGATVQNIGFHDVDYHSGEPYDGTDWTPTVESDRIVWSTDDYGVNPDANALRWGTTYNFWFDTDAPPAVTNVTLGLFRPGSPTEVGAVTQGPAVGPVDCNSNGIPDDQDIADGTSADCNSNFIPDECESFPTTPLATVQVASGLSSPVFVGAPAGDFDRLFIVEQTGRIKILDLTTTTVLPTPFLNIASLISAGGERGLLSVAFHPDYSSNGLFYFNYTNTAGHTVIAQYSVSGDPDVADAGSAVILKTIVQDFPNHNGGQLQFGPDGMLYVGMGDGGSGGDPFERAQDDNSLLGKMLRLDVDNGPSYIPADNPGSPFLPEVWAKGLRNPWRFSFDRQTGDMYVGDVGQNAWEEIDFQPADSAGGENYGWDCLEGTNCLTSDVGCDCEDPTLVMPILEYSHSGGACSVTGGYVYRGCEMPDLAGTYFYAEYCADWIRTFRYVDGVVTDQQDRTAELTEGGAINAISSFGEDAAGEMYIVSLGGSVYKIVPDTGPGVCGNGILEPGEQCDDGGTVPGDGCDENCQLEVPGDTCEQALVACPDSYAGTTAEADNDGSATCGSSSSSPDVWFRYTPLADGTATFSLCTETAFDSVLSVHSDCPGDTGNQLACDDDGCGTSGGPSTVTLAVTAETTYLVRIAGYEGATGSFTLTVTGPDCIESCETVLFEDNFETDQGWVAVNLGASSGDWQRGVPVDDPGWDYDPASDSDGSGQAYLTQNEAGNTDVDGGAVRLTSPTIDMSVAGITISYDYFLRLTNETGGVDRLLVEMNTNDGAGAWTEVARHDTDGGLDWRSHTIGQAALDAAGVTPTATTKIRFTANDADPQSIVEAGLDAFAVTGFDCGTIVPGDFDSDGDADTDDFANWPVCVTGPDGGPIAPSACEVFDFDGDMDIDFEDFAEFQIVFTGSL